MIKIVRLVSGEIIIGEISEHDDGSVAVVRPALMHMQMVEAGQLGVGMVPYHPWIEGPVVFWASALFGPPNDVDEHTRNGYNQRFNPDAIIVPKSSSGILLG